MTRLAIALACALLLAPAALASERHPTLNELENEVMCPVCGTTLAQSDSAAAKQIEREIQVRIRAGWTKTQIKNLLVQQYGESILASPPTHGFNLLAWLLPIVGLLGAAAVLGVAAWGWSRGRAEPDVAEVQSSNGQGPMDPELERRLDEALSRFD
ncbi:MAG TPA: cytochrome c-type biogenesis protein CcmH [Gaiellaceae bacterium]